MLYEFSQMTGTMTVVFLLLAVWTMIWKGIGLWHSAKNQQKGWFIAMLILNTLGLLPIIYLIWFKPKERYSPPDKNRKLKIKGKKK